MILCSCPRALADFILIVGHYFKGEHIKVIVQYEFYIYNKKACILKWGHEVKDMGELNAELHKWEDAMFFLPTLVTKHDISAAQTFDQSFFFICPNCREVQ